MSTFVQTKRTEEEERIATIIVNAAFTIHKSLGHGLLEKVYEVCLAHELTKNGLEVIRQVDIPIVYDGITFDDRCAEARIGKAHYGGGSLFWLCATGPQGQASRGGIGQAGGGFAYHCGNATRISG